MQELIKPSNIKKLVITSRKEASLFSSLDDFPKDTPSKVYRVGVDNLNDICDNSNWTSLFLDWLKTHTPIATYHVVKFNLPYCSNKFSKLITDNSYIEDNQMNHPWRVGTILDCKVDDELMICEIL